MYVCIINRKYIVVGPETNEKMDPKGHYPPNTNSHCIILNCIQITLHYLQCQISAMSLVLGISKTGTCQLTVNFTFL